MIDKISIRFGVAPEKLGEAGVFDAYIGIDNKLFVDPVLLKNAKTPEFRAARKKVEAYFAGRCQTRQESTRGGRDQRST